LFCLVVLTWALTLVSTEANADQGLRVLSIPPASAGRGQVQLEVTDPAVEALLQRSTSPEVFRAVTGVGSARVEAVHGVANTGRVVTVLAFDQSGSFAKYWPQAFALAKGTYPALLGKTNNHLARVMTFGVRSTPSEAVTTEAELKQLLESVSEQKANQPATRLKAFILDAAKLAATDVPQAQGGVREVVVFTDAGEESDAYGVQELVHDARELGVRIHVVAFYKSSGSATRLAPHLDQMKRLAEGTGGRFMQVDDNQQALTALASTSDSASHTYWLDLSFCGLPGSPTTFDDKFSLEVNDAGHRLGWAEPVTFHQQALGAALAACSTSGATTNPNSPTASNNGHTTATQPATTAGSNANSNSNSNSPTNPTANPNANPNANANPNSPTNPGSNANPNWNPNWNPLTTAGSSPDSSTAPAPQDEHFPWWWVVFALLVVAGLLWAMRRREEPEPVVAPPVKPPATPNAVTAPTTPAATPNAPPVANPNPPVATATPNAASAWSDPFASLPETKLVVVRGPSGIEPFYRLHKREFSIGAAAGEVDLVVDLPQLSGKHATFQLFQTGNVFVVDERSTNGTFVDGRKLAAGERVQLRPGQTIQLSRSFEVRLEQPGTSTQAASPSPSPIASGANANNAAPEPEQQPTRNKAKTIYAPIGDRDKE
jgi:hypothetical protein